MNYYIVFFKFVAKITKYKLLKIFIMGNFILILYAIE